MSLEYSPEGLNCLPLFDKSAKTISIGVEGEEDIPFWDGMISSCIDTNGYKVVCIPQGGCKKIIKQLIERGETQNFIAIVDSEYDEIIHDKDILKQNPFTILTIRHSIENYLFCSNSLAKLIKKINKTSAINYHKNCEDFQEELCKRLKRILFYACQKECKPEIFPPGLKILGGDSNIAKFTVNNHYLPEISKIDEFIVNNHLENIDISDIEKLFEDKNLFCFLNGHFITFSIFAFINSKISKGKMKLGKEMLYNFLYDYCPNCTNKCSDFINVVNQLQTAINKKIE